MKVFFIGVLLVRLCFKFCRRCFVGNAVGGDVGDAVGGAMWERLLDVLQEGLLEEVCLD